jgi:magnesium transporter
LTALERLVVLRRDLLAFRRLAVAQQEVLRRVGRVFPEVRAQLADVADNQREATDTATATCDYIDGAIEAYRVRRDADTEDGIRRLTVLAGILGPLSLLIGFWQVNFPNIPGSGWAFGWPVFVGLQLTLIALGVWYFRRRGML